MSTHEHTSPEDATGGPDAVAILVENHRSFLRFLEHRVGSREVAEDILQTAFGRAVDHAGELRDESVVAWFYRVLRNAVTDHFRRADVFVLTSREDASPLVCLEAASVGIPLVCFDNGGVPELLGPQGCVEIAYPDLDAMAAALATLADDPHERRERGRAAARRVREAHDIVVTGPLLQSVIARWAP